jgi:hypothetical protein
MDLTFERGYHGRELTTAYDVMDVNGIKLVNWRRGRVQGGMVTFDQNVINKVGGMDPKFGMCSHEHVDWTIRNRRAGLAPGSTSWDDGCYDVLGSNKYVKLNLKDYHPSCEREGKREGQKYFDTIKNTSSRIYLPLQILEGDIIYGR